MQPSTVHNVHVEDIILISGLVKSKYIRIYVRVKLHTVTPFSRSYISSSFSSIETLYDTRHEPAWVRVIAHEQWNGQINIPR